MSLGENMLLSLSYIIYIFLDTSWILHLEA